MPFLGTSIKDALRPVMGLPGYEDINATFSLLARSDQRSDNRLHDGGVDPAGRRRAGISRGGGITPCSFAKHAGGQRLRVAEFAVDVAAC
jgi:hypothetical protein